MRCIAYNNCYGYILKYYLLSALYFLFRKPTFCSPLSSTLGCLLCWVFYDSVLLHYLLYKVFCFIVLTGCFRAGMWQTFSVTRQWLSALCIYFIFLFQLLGLAFAEQAQFQTSCKLKDLTKFGQEVRFWWGL